MTNRAQRAENHQEAGVALVFALVVMSIVVLIGLSVSLTALRMYTNAATVRDSIAATFAMDAALECALYHAQQSPNPFAGGATTITCNGSSVTTTVAGGTHRFEVPVGLGVGRAEVSSSGGATQVQASGYSRSLPHAARLVGRSLELEVSSGGVPQRADILLVLDASSSIEESHRDIIRAALQELLNRFTPELGPTNLQLGILHFGEFAGERTDPGAYIRTPHVPLTSDPYLLAQYVANSVYPTYQYVVDNSISGTNLAQALAVSRAELTGRTYETNTYENASFNGSPPYSYFPPTYRDRNDATWPDHVIVLTDGIPTNFTPASSVASDATAGGEPESRAAAKAMADLLKADGITIHVIGVNINTTTENYLRNQIASSPTNYAGSVFELDSILGAFAQLFRSAQLKDMR